MSLHGFDQAEAADAPVFLLAGGGRTGSTLIQRLIVSTGRVLVWGEHGGFLLPQLAALIEQTGQWVADVYGDRMREDFLAGTGDGWIANMNPVQSAFQSGIRGFLDHSLGATAHAMGYPRWGFKEIRYGAAEALLLQALYPGARFVLLVRNPVSCLRSIKAMGWYGSDFRSDPAIFLGQWAKITAGLMDVLPLLGNACFLRYEDAVSDPDATIDRMGAVIGVPASSFDRTVLDSVLRGHAPAPVPISDEDRRALDASAIRSLASRVGYPSLE